MCDCYQALCSSCQQVLVSTHIADFCISRKDLHVICPRCTPKILTEGLSNYIISSGSQPRGHGAHIAFIDQVEEKRQIHSLPKKRIKPIEDCYDTPGKPIGVVGQSVLFLTNIDEAYGIHLN